MTRLRSYLSYSIVALAFSGVSLLGGDNTGLPIFILSATVSIMTLVGIWQPKRWSQVVIPLMLSCAFVGSVLGINIGKLGIGTAAAMIVLLGLFSMAINSLMPDPTVETHPDSTVVADG